MKNLLLLLFFLAPVWASAQDMYFEAMQDELSRTQRELQIEGSSKPYFTAFWLTKRALYDYESLFGETVSIPAQQELRPRLFSYVHMIVGDKKENSHNFVQSNYYEPIIYEPVSQSFIGDGYDAIRSSFWQLADQEYRGRLDIYAQKEAFKRQKNIVDKSPDFAPAKQGVFIDEEMSFPVPDKAYYEDLAKALSAEAKKYPHLESAYATVSIYPKTLWYLNSQGGKMRLSEEDKSIYLTAQIRNKDGFKQDFSKSLDFFNKPFADKETLIKQADAFYKKVNDAYSAQKIEPYVGPVLFKPEAALTFIETLFIKNISNTKPLLSALSADETAGGFKDKIGQRVFAKQFVVEDKPLLREYKGTPLAGFVPVDDEGVPGENLVLVKNGKLLDLPFSRSLTQGRKKSNGHARVSYRQRPRAGVTNLFITPQETFTQQELEQKLLDRCRELDLEYGYIVEYLPNLQSTLPILTRIYVKDGHKELVYGAKITDLTPRSLRDILAAGDDETSFNLSVGYAPRHSVTVPSLLVDEVEFAPADDHPDRKPFVSRPK